MSGLHQMTSHHYGVQPKGAGMNHSSEESDLRGVPILVVEDDPASARLLAVLLRTVGSDVRIASSAEEALTLLREFPARVLVLDLVLPRMSGLLLAQQLKQSSATRHIVVIAVSVVDGPETERLALESGCAAYVRKPIDIDSFTSTLIALLKGRS
jgi:two-component system cell cycle response regulator DivK